MLGISRTTNKRARVFPNEPVGPYANRDTLEKGATPLELDDRLRSFGEDFHPRRSHGIMEYEVEEELSLYDPREESVHILNPTAAAIWRLCDGNRGVTDISAQFAEVYGLMPAAVEEDVREVISKFLQAGLLAQPGRSSWP